ncbi:MAG: hypothetical protein QOJ21_2558 [Solirubrobacteraceae bacterium]|jgi:hypothetical protein|nr:hypothetical protein [Solirubrobacteraceae bacterium]
MHPLPQLVLAAVLRVTTPFSSTGQARSHGHGADGMRLTWRAPCVATRLPRRYCAALNRVSRLHGTRSAADVAARPLRARHRRRDGELVEELQVLCADVGSVARGDFGWRGAWLPTTMRSSTCLRASNPSRTRSPLSYGGRPVALALVASARRPGRRYRRQRHGDRSRAARVGARTAALRRGRCSSAHGVGAVRCRAARSAALGSVRHGRSEASKPRGGRGNRRCGVLCTASTPGDANAGDTRGRCPWLRQPPCGRVGA